jgi:glycosyltransferase involved in cell wall biosynthesis
LKKSEHLIHKSRKNIKFNGYFDGKFKKLYTILDQNKIHSNKVLLSIVLPVYNEENTVRKVLSSLPKHNLIEVVVVDDHSMDKSFEEIKTLKEDLNLKLIRHSKNRGYGKALLTGIVNSTGIIILTMDSDGQHRPEDIFNLVEPILTKKADITIGSRYIGTYNYKLPVSTRIGEAVIEKFMIVLYRQKIMNNQGGFRAFHKNTLEIFEDIKFEDYAFTTEILLKAALSKFKIKESPIHLVNREYGSSKINLPKLLLNLMLCILYYMIQWVNRPYVNKWMIKRLIFLKNLPIYGNAKRIQDVATSADKVISVVYYNR